MLQIRVRQLIQEAVDARAEAVKLKMALKDLKNKKEKKSLSDKSTMTEVIEMTPDVPTPRTHPDPPVMSASFPPSPQAEKAVQPTTLTIPQEILLQLQVNRLYSRIAAECRHFQPVTWKLAHGQTFE